MRTVVYPGSFDPFTNGHLDIVKRARLLFDRVVVAVMVNSAKKNMFTVEQRLEMIKKSIAGMENVQTVPSSDMLVRLAREQDACAIIKGIRSIGDMENELLMSLINKTQYPELETVLITADQEYIYLSSTVVREVGGYGGDISKMVPAAILEDVKKGLRR